MPSSYVIPFNLARDTKANRGMPEYLQGAELQSRICLQAQHVLHQESVGVVPWQEHILDHSKDALLFEAQGLSMHHRGVHQVQPQCICPILFQDL